MSEEHHHEHKYRKDIINRLSKVEGHLRSVKEMAINGRQCPDILLQIAAVQKALDGAAKLLLKDHLENCVVDAVHHGDEAQVIAELNAAINSYIR
ncbi:metal-sensing transcriptional repressor [Paenibacillus sonchi]|uniref:Metal-sensing transcriptional repressor n=1 Tax=Paenibacillus sonchi TaxID=373687 RepID=A0A974SE10_9BACL|nr:MULTISPECIES: metal-sensing transcriptional repressor [Paenibacillus]MEC0236642.1 metal-sensing transcriptional repressor [Paenibacillus kribbensis]QQZ62019.1 metal-sensing transcriptional repressor [Paenibacillus sonchi]